MPFFGVPIRNGLPIGLGSVAGFGVQQFDPSQLFEGGTVAGAWYDPSDLSTMFDTSAGTTPVAMPGQGAAVPVGLMLDKSQGLVLGSELVTNGDFSGGTTGWTNVSATIASVSGELQISNQSGSPSSTIQTLTTVVGRTYAVTATYRQEGSGGTAARISFFGVNSENNSTSTPMTRTIIVTATTTNPTLSLQSFGTSSTISYFDNISVRELPGNHAIAFNDTTARPELRARVNLLTYSEDWSVSPWTNIIGGTAGTPTLTANAGIAPDGTATATRIQFTLNGGTTTSDNVRRRQVITTPAGSNTFSFYVRSFDGVSTYRMQYEDANGFISGIDVTGSWQRITATTVYGAVGTGLGMGLRGGQSPANSDTADVLVWGADLRPANIGANVPAYQRIADALTYDTSGFPLYLFFTTDDSMYTPANLNLSGTDKVAVFAGVRKLIAVGTANRLVELSSTIGSNNGSFTASAPDGGTTQYAFVSKGTVAAIPLTSSATYEAPITNVLTGIGDIGGDVATLRLNGVSVQTLTTDQGAGNYGTYPLFIGARNNASQWLNGHIYSLIIAGSAVSAGNISATEQWVAQKTGIQI